MGALRIGSPLSGEPTRSNLCSLCKGRGIFDIDPEIPDQILDLAVTEQNLNCPQFAIAMQMIDALIGFREGVP